VAELVQAAQQGIVLLKNEKNTLPLSKSLTVAVIGALSLSLSLSLSLVIVV
jgi:beta-glucosidase-like glycosyl hydrolase